VRLEGLGQSKKSTSSVDLPACSIVPQPTTIPRAPPEVIPNTKPEGSSVVGRPEVELVR
jgi:hypothetical protein